MKNDETCKPLSRFEEFRVGDITVTFENFRGDLYDRKSNNRVLLHRESYITLEQDRQKEEFWFVSGFYVGPDFNKSPMRIFQDRALFKALRTSPYFTQSAVEQYLNRNRIRKP